jgi:GntR family transcriptional regulator, transcriptional repressor for pyruvate dehydrogenase complex
MLKPVEKQRVADEIVEQLRSLILTGKYAPGERLPAERDLAKKLGVNRASLREALKRLEQAGLVTIRQGDGTRVTNFMETAGIELVAHLIPVAGGGLRDLVRDVLEFRVIYGRELARMAAARADEDDIRRLEKVAARADAPDLGSRELFLADFEFYAALTAATRNRVMVLLINTVREQVMRYAALLSPAIVTADVVRDHHRDLVAAVAASDPERAADVARAYLERGAAEVLRLVDAGAFDLLTARS